jgi:hypothetical protein
LNIKKTIYQTSNNKQQTKMSMAIELVTSHNEVIEKQMAMLVDDKETDTKPKKEKLYQKDKLSTQEVITRLSNVTWNMIPPPSKNKGSRGQMLELALGIPNSSALTDLSDGEVKTYTIGETICITQLNHCLHEIIKQIIPFEESKLGIKLQQILYIAFNKNGTYKGSALLNKDIHPLHFEHLVEDYNHICIAIRNIYINKGELYTITGPNELLQIRTKASKNKNTGNYTPLVYEKHILKNKYMAFYLRSDFGKKLFNN